MSLGEPKSEISCWTAEDHSSDDCGLVAILLPEKLQSERLELESKSKGTTFEDFRETGAPPSEVYLSHTGEIG
jgi:hypothetical protein